MSEQEPKSPPLRRRERVFGRADVWALMLGGAAVLMLYLFLSVRESIDRPPPAEAVSTPQSEPLRATLLVGSVEVLPTKANGKAWDVRGGLPDPRVTVVNKTRAQSKATEPVSDALQATFDAETVIVREGDEVYVRVEDVDVQFDDLIGETRFRVTREMIEKGELERGFGQVKRLTLRFKR